MTFISAEWKIFITLLLVWQHSIFIFHSVSVSAPIAISIRLVHSRFYTVLWRRCIVSWNVDVTI